VQSGQPDFLELQTGGSVINSGELNSRYLAPRQKLENGEVRESACFTDEDLNRAAS
jgi:hypothetical protein